MTNANAASRAPETADLPVRRVAVVGSGPAGFYAAEALLRSKAIHAYVDMFERLPTPYGLVRGGVAPDHQKIKRVTRVYDKTAASERFRFFGNVHIGSDLPAEELRAHYDDVIYAVGAETGRDISVPGRGALGYTPAAVFVGWYNGHPDYQAAHFDLDVKRVAVIGNGNVAMDVARVLARTPEELARTDIAAQALRALCASQVEEILVIGRRGAAQAAFSPTELKELRELDAVEVLVDPADVVLDPASQAALDAADPKSNMARNVALLQDIAAHPPQGGSEAEDAAAPALTREGGDQSDRDASAASAASAPDGAFCGAGQRPRKRRIRFLFLRSPEEILVDEDNRVRGVRLRHNVLQAREDGSLGPVASEQTSEIDVGMVIPAVGFYTEPVEGVAYDSRRKRIANIDGRVVEPDTGAVRRGEYVVGWARSGPKGLIGAHRSASREVVNRLVADVLAGRDQVHAPATSADISATLARYDVRATTFADWQRLNAIEVARGQIRGAPREKITSMDHMMAALAEGDDEGAAAGPTSGS